MTFQEVQAYAKAQDAKLHTYDFKSAIVIHHSDHSIFDINGAILERLDDDTTSDGWTIVYTEHHGTFIYGTGEIDELHVWEGR